MSKERYYTIEELKVTGQVINGQSPLIDKRVKLGKGNVFYPCVVIEILSSGSKVSSERK